MLRKILLLLKNKMTRFLPPWEEFDLRVKKSIDAYLAEAPEYCDIALHEIREHVCNDVNAEFQRNFPGDRRGVKLWPNIKREVIAYIGEKGYVRTDEGKYILKHKN